MHTESTSLSAFARRTRRFFLAGPALPSRRRWLASVAAAIAVAASFGVLPAAAARDDDRWVATWAASPQRADVPLALNGQTIRQVLRISLGGDTVRVRLSNAFGTGDLVIGSAHVALHASGPVIIPSSDRVLKFNGSPTITIPPGALVVSDPVRLNAGDLRELVVSLYLPGAVSAVTEHSLGVQTTYISPAGDYTGATTFVPATTRLSSNFVTGVEVAGGARSRAIVTLGDSITDGYASTPDANRRWPDRLAERLQARRGQMRIGIANAGISGNRVLHDVVGPNALARLDRDVLVQSGAKYVVVLEGINDLGLPGAFGFPDQVVTAEQVITGHKQIIDRAHAIGLRVYGATLLPFEGTIFPGYYSSAGEAKRQTINRWIRTSGAYDAVIDFDRVMRDPSNPLRMRPAYDSGDHLHPNDAGYKAMADAVDLSLFREFDDD